MFTRGLVDPFVIPNEFGMNRTRGHFRVLSHHEQNVWKTSNADGEFCQPTVGGRTRKHSFGLGNSRCRGRPHKRHDELGPQQALFILSPIRYFESIPAGWVCSRRVQRRSFCTAG